MEIQRADFQFWEGNNALVVRQQAWSVRRRILLILVLEGEVCVVGVCFFVVFVIRIVQMYKIYDAEFFLMGEVMDKMMEKCAHFEKGLHSLTYRRIGRQNLECKE